MNNVMKEQYYKRDVSLMDTNIFPRKSLDMSIHNPDFSNSFFVSASEKSDQEIVDFVVSELKKTGTK